MFWEIIHASFNIYKEYIRKNKSVFMLSSVNISMFVIIWIGTKNNILQ
jgi:hypothetical protein